MAARRGRADQVLPVLVASDDLAPDVGRSGNCAGGSNAITRNSRASSASITLKGERGTAFITMWRSVPPHMPSSPFAEHFFPRRSTPWTIADVGADISNHCRFRPRTRSRDRAPGSFVAIRSAWSWLGKSRVPHRSMGVRQRRRRRSPRTPANEGPASSAPSLSRVGPLDSSLAPAMLAPAVAASVSLK